MNGEEMIADDVDYSHAVSDAVAAKIAGYGGAHRAEAYVWSTSSLAVRPIQDGEPDATVPATRENLLRAAMIEAARVLLVLAGDYLMLHPERSRADAIDDAIRSAMDWTDEVVALCRAPRELRDSDEP